MSQKQQNSISKFIDAPLNAPINTSLETNPEEDKYRIKLPPIVSPERSHKNNQLIHVGEFNVGPSGKTSAINSLNGSPEGNSQKYHYSNLNISQIGLKQKLVNLTGLQDERRRRRAKRNARFLAAPSLMSEELDQM